MDLHDRLKLYKHGFSKVTDHACREIRHGRITRDQGINLIKKFELNKTSYDYLFGEWLGISPLSVNFLAEQAMNPKFWVQTENRKRKFNGLSRHLKCTNKQQANKPLFFSNSTLEVDGLSGYITIGKGC